MTTFYYWFYHPPTHNANFGEIALTDVSGVTTHIADIADPPINCDPPSFVETQAVVNQLKWGKTPGICGIHAEILKTGGNAELVSSHAVLCSAWNTGINLTDWKWGFGVPLWKGKGDRQDCNIYRGVTLLSLLGKVFARIIIDRVRHHLLEHQHPKQLGFTPNRSTIDRILALRVLTEHRREFQQRLLAAYVDLCKAFDSVNPDALWRVLGLRGVPPKLINLMSELYSDTESAVKCSDTISDLFPVVTGGCEGCDWPLHFSALVWTRFWGGCQTDQAAGHHLGMSRSLTLILQMMQSSLRRLWISFSGPSRC